MGRKKKKSLFSGILGEDAAPESDGSQESEDSTEEWEDDTPAPEVEKKKGEVSPERVPAKRRKFL